MTSTSRKPTVAFAHLGCEKNRVDTEHMLGLLTNAGYGVSADEDDAAVVVVNTCSFIQDAREESVRTLVNLAEQGKELIIAGCLAQHFQDELLESIPEAKAIVGTGDYAHAVEVMQGVEAGERVKRALDVLHDVGVATEHLPLARLQHKRPAEVVTAHATSLLHDDLARGQRRVDRAIRECLVQLVRWLRRHRLWPVMDDRACP